MYTDKIKQSSKNNSFLFKLTIFCDIYVGADISQEILLKAFSNIFTSLTLDYYYSNTNINATATFNKIQELIQIYFKEAE